LGEGGNRAAKRCEPILTTLFAHESPARACPPRRWAACPALWHWGYPAVGRHGQAAQRCLGEGTGERRQRKLALVGTLVTFGSY